MVWSRGCSCACAYDCIVRRVYMGCTAGVPRLFVHVATDWRSRTIRKRNQRGTIRRLLVHLDAFNLRRQHLPRNTGETTLGLSSRDRHAEVAPWCSAVMECMDLPALCIAVCRVYCHLTLRNAARALVWCVRAAGWRSCVRNGAPSTHPLPLAHAIAPIRASPELLYADRCLLTLRI